MSRWTGLKAGVLVAAAGAALVLLAGLTVALLVPPSPGDPGTEALVNPTPPSGLEAWGSEGRLALPEGLGAQALAWGPEGLVVLGVDSVAVYRRADGSAPVRTVALDFSPLALAVDGQGLWYLSSGAEVLVLGTDGRQVHRWSVPGTGALVLGLAVGGTRLYAADAGQKEVWVYDLVTGDLTSLVPPADQGFVVPGPQFALAADGEGVLVANPGRHGLQRFSPAGTVLESWLRPGRGWEEFQGCCNPVAVALVSRPVGPPWVVTAEKGAARVKVLDRKGRLRAVLEDTGGGTPGGVALGLAADPEGRVYVLDPVKQEIRVHGRRGG